MTPVIVIILQCTDPRCTNARPMTDRDMTALIVYCEQCGALMLPYRAQELRPQTTQAKASKQS